MMPPAASWSRLRHLADESQRPLRTRAFPLSLPELDSKAVSQTQGSNRQLEVTSWICEQAAQCKNRRVAILLSFPEDFAGHVSHGPASPWALEDFRNLQQHAGEVKRCAVYLCRFAGTKQRRAVGCWSNFRASQQEGYAGWPSHVKHTAQLQYTGPLPRSCPCVTQHTREIQLDAPADTGCGSISVGLCLSFSASVNCSFSAVLVFIVPSLVFGIAHTKRSQRLRRPTDCRAVFVTSLGFYLSMLAQDDYLRLHGLFSKSKLASDGADHQVDTSPHVPSVKTTAASDSSPGYVAPPARDAPSGRSTISSSLLFPSPPSPFLVSPGRSRSCRRRKRRLASWRQRGNDGGKAVASGSGIAVASGRELVRLRFLCNVFVGRPC